MLLARRLTFRSRLVRSGCTFAEVAICGSERTGAVIVSPLSRLGDEVIQQQQYDQGVCREKDCSLYKIAVRTHMLCILSIAKSCFCLGYHATETPPTGPRSFS